MKEEVESVVRPGPTVNLSLSSCPCLTSSSSSSSSEEEEEEETSNTPFFVFFVFFLFTKQVKCATSWSVLQVLLCVDLWFLILVCVLFMNKGTVQFF